jgi:hypothetical protein
MKKVNAVDERTKTILIWLAVIIVILGLRLLCDWVLVVLPPPEVVTVTSNLSVFERVGTLP